MVNSEEDEIYEERKWSEYSYSKGKELKEWRRKRDSEKDGESGRNEEKGFNKRRYLKSDEKEKGN